MTNYYARVSLSTRRFRRVSVKVYRCIDRDGFKQDLLIKERFFFTYRGAMRHARWAVVKESVSSGKTIFIVDNQLFQERVEE